MQYFSSVKDNNYTSIPAQLGVFVLKIVMPNRWHITITRMPLLSPVTIFFVIKKKTIISFLILDFYTLGYKLVFIPLKINIWKIFFVYLQRRKFIKYLTYFIPEQISQSTIFLRHLFSEVLPASSSSEEGLGKGGKFSLFLFEAAAALLTRSAFQTQRLLALGRVLLRFSISFIKNPVWSVELKKSWHVRPQISASILLTWSLRGVEG